MSRRCKLKVMRKGEGERVQMQNNANWYAQVPPLLLTDSQIID